MDNIIKEKNVYKENNVNNEIVQKKFLLIIFNKKINITELPNHWINFINSIYFIKDKNYNFIEFNNTYEYYNIIKKNEKIKLDNKLAKFYKVNNKPLALNDPNKILLINFSEHVNIKINCNFFKILLGLLSNIKKILIIKTKGSLKCLIQFDSIEESKRIKLSLEKMVKLLETKDISIFYSKKNTIKIDKVDTEQDKNDYIFDFKYIKNLKKKINFDDINSYYNFFYQKINYVNCCKFEKNNLYKNSIFLSKEIKDYNYDYLNKYVSKYCLILKLDKTNNISFEKIKKLLSWYLNNFKLIYYKKIYLFFYDSQNYLKFKIWFKNYLNNNFNFKIKESSINNELILLLFINKANPENLKKLLYSNLKHELKIFIINEIYFYLLNSSKFYINLKNLINKNSKIFLIRFNENFIINDIFRFKFLFFKKLKLIKNYCLIIFENNFEIFNFILKNNYIIKIKDLNKKFLLKIKNKDRKLFELVNKYLNN